MELDEGNCLNCERLIHNLLRIGECGIPKYSTDDDDGWIIRYGIWMDEVEDEHVYVLINN
jgi:hypothetical protein